MIFAHSFFRQIILCTNCMCIDGIYDKMYQWMKRKFEYWTNMKNHDSLIAIFHEWRVFDFIMKISYNLLSKLNQMKKYKVWMICFNCKWTDIVFCAILYCLTWTCFMDFTSTFFFILFTTWVFGNFLTYLFKWNVFVYNWNI